MMQNWQKKVQTSNQILEVVNATLVQCSKPVIITLIRVNALREEFTDYREMNNLVWAGVSNV